jgi:organic hydroperoxide reductase OsmC/OhrA
MAQLHSSKRHTYRSAVKWTGNTGDGTKTYSSYTRNHVVECAGKPPIPGSSDPAFRGDPARYNPEELLVASLSGCHMLSYLHMCAVNGVCVVEYEDAAEGVMQENADGSGEFRRVVLRPRVKITAESDAGKAMELHHKAHEICFIARSVSFPVEVEPSVSSEG